MKPLHALLTAMMVLVPWAPTRADDFARRVDADGDLVLAADQLAVAVQRVSTGSVESADLLALVGLTDVTGVLDVALDGDLAVVLVERSGSGAGGLLLSFRRTLPGGVPTWVSAGQADPVDDFFHGQASMLTITEYHGFVELRGDVIALAQGFVAQGTSRYALMTGYAQRVNGPVYFSESSFQPGTISSLAVGAPLPVLGAPDEVAAVVGVHLTAGLAPTLVRTFAISADAAQVTITSTHQGTPGSDTDFGVAVALQDGILAIGEPGADLGGSDTGRVLLYDISTSSTPLLALTSPAPTDGDRFGRALALSTDGQRLAISKRHADVLAGANGAGVVRLARPGDVSEGEPAWTLSGDTLGFGATLAAPGADFGADLSFASDDLLVVGAPGDAPLDGFLAAFDLPATPWIQTQQSPALAGTGGVLPRLRLEAGVFADGPLVLGVRDAAPNSTTFALLGFSPLLAPAKGGLVYPSIDVLKLFPTDGAGRFLVKTTWTPEFVALGPLDLHVQFWTADPGAVLGFSATDGGVLHQH